MKQWAGMSELTCVASRGCVESIKVIARFHFLTLEWIYWVIFVFLFFLSIRIDLDSHTFPSITRPLLDRTPLSHLTNHTSNRPNLLLLLALHHSLLHLLPLCLLLLPLLPVIVRGVPAPCRLARLDHVLDVEGRVPVPLPQLVADLNEMC